MYMEAVRKERKGRILSFKLLHYTDTSGEQSLCNMGTPTVTQLIIQSLSIIVSLHRHTAVTHFSLVTGVIAT